MLAGVDPGAPGLPATAPTAPEPACLYELLADGVAIVKGVPSGADIHEDIPREAWLRIGPVTFDRRPYDSEYFESVAAIPCVPRARTWRDLRFTETGVDALKAAVGQDIPATKGPRKDPLRPTPEFDDLLDLDQAIAVVSAFKTISMHDAWQWLSERLTKGHIQRFYQQPVKEWQEAPIPMPGDTQQDPLPARRYWRVRRSGVEEALRSEDTGLEKLIAWFAKPQQSALPVAQSMRAENPNGSTLPRARPEGTPTLKPSLKASRECYAHLVVLMKSGPPSRSKPEYRAEFLQNFGGRLTGRTFDAQWARAVEDTGASEWSAPGRKSKGKSNRAAISPIS